MLSDSLNSTDISTNKEKGAHKGAKFRMENVGFDYHTSCIVEISNITAYSTSHFLFVLTSPLLENFPFLPLLLFINYGLTNVSLN